MPNGKERSAAYTAAMSRLREAHRDELDGYLVEEYGKVGIEWKPRPTETGKAKAEIERLLEAHPELRNLFAVGNDPANTPGTPSESNEPGPAPTS